MWKSLYRALQLHELGADSELDTALGRLWQRKRIATSVGAALGALSTEEALVRRVRGCLQRTRRAHTRVLREVGLVEATTEHDGAPPTSNTGIR
jgi:hypothetical protein